MSNKKLIRICPLIEHRFLIRCQARPRDFENRVRSSIKTHYMSSFGSFIKESAPITLPSIPHAPLGTPFMFHFDLDCIQPLILSKHIKLAIFLYAYSRKALILTSLKYSWKH